MPLRSHHIFFPSYLFTMALIGSVWMGCVGVDDESSCINCVSGINDTLGQPGLWHFCR